jgi:S-DNA-T family DNA segregation ATPase FtsK/SpoIIIE
VRILTPTENRRINELFGFVGITIAVLLALSLLSYSPHDPSLNVAAPGSAAARNWIGPVGAHLADVLFQFCGYAAFLVPIGFFLLGLDWLRSSPVQMPTAKIIGSVLLLLSLPSEMTLLHLPDVRGALPPGGMLGTILAEGLRAGFNSLGAHLVALASVLVALFLTTRFSFSWAAQALKGPMGENRIGGRLVERWRDWRDAREAERLRKRLEEIKIAGRPPVPLQTIGGKDSLAPDSGDQAETEAPPPTVISFPEPASAETRRAPDVKIVRGKAAFRLPSPGLLRLAERGEKMGEA